MTNLPPSGDQPAQPPSALSTSTSTTPLKTASDPDGHLEPTLTPDLTPSETPPRSLNHSLAAGSKPAMEATNADGQVTGDVQPTPAEASSAPKPELKQGKSGDACTKKNCKAKHKRTKKATKGKKAEEPPSDASDSSSSDDSSSDSDDAEDTTESDTSSSDESESESDTEKQKRKRRARKAAARKLKARSKRKGKSQRHKESSSESESKSDDASSASESEAESSEDEVPKKKAKKSKSRRGKSKRQRRAAPDSSAEDEDSDEFAGIRTQIDELNESLASAKLVAKKRGGKSGRLRLGRKGKGSRLRSGGSKKKKRGSRLEYKRVDQLWDSSIHDYKLTDTAENEDGDEYDQYIFTVRRKFDWEGKYESTAVDIKSRALKEALNSVMDGVKGVSLVEDTPVLDPNMLFLYLEEMRAAMKEFKKKAKTERKKKAKKAAARKAAHVKILVKYLDKDYAETKKTLYPLLESDTITFDLLWALFKPNTIAYTPTYGNADEPRAFKIEYATKESSFMRGTWYCVEGRYLEYDGKSFGMGTMEVDVDAFKGPRRITSLSTYPLKYHKDEAGLRRQLVERGRRFVALKGMNYRFHKGMAFMKKKRAVIKVNINGRVMVDPAIHRRINPNYPISTVKPKDADELFGDDDGSDCDSCCCGSSDDDERAERPRPADDDDAEPKKKIKFVVDDKGDVQVLQVDVDADGDEVVPEKLDKLDGDEGKRERAFSDDELLLASPVVLGFAFGEKLWLEFAVSGIREIEWNEGAFRSLVLPENQKSIVKALVESHTFHAAQNIDDVIQGKGRGLVAVLHGPPGTGKTLTAEGIAELLKCPLYMVSAGELGTDPRTLEAELNKILDIAHSWGAVLLLDEADVFLEKRTIQDIHRNALVSIFLRLLEYFQGILFLTTNRVETFDDAFQSRIHIALRYGELTSKAKKTVWKMFLERVQAMDGVETAVFGEADYDTLARNNLNGRQIKNCVRTAQALAVNNGEKLSMSHIKRVLDVAESFDHDLKGGTGYMDAMRSYT
ncbi:MAG: hypothetical protein M1832_004050 [Thelocarpon impressellum]|nr:MAG: hypothetical protein M1832_004050 [Thelocarpon impressellum]